MIYEPTPEARAYLEQLASYLESLPSSYRGLTMERYYDPEFRRSKPPGKPEREYALTNGSLENCGAVACALGHGPAAGILFLESETRGVLVSWFRYCERILGLRCATSESPARGPGDIVYDWLFSGGWADVDNTVRGAAARIRYALAGEDIPEFGVWTAASVRRYARYRVRTPRGVTS